MVLRRMSCFYSQSLVCHNTQTGMYIMFTCRNGRINTHLPQSAIFQLYHYGLLQEQRSSIIRWRWRVNHFSETVNLIPILAGSVHKHEVHLCAPYSDLKSFHGIWSAYLMHSKCAVSACLAWWCMEIKTKQSYIFQMLNIETLFAVTAVSTNCNLNLSVWSHRLQYITWQGKGG